jgi:hypothetical protein
MAKIRSGIIGNIKGNIAGVNGGVVKSRCYLRKRWFDQGPENSSSKQDRINGFVDMANVWKFLADPFLRLLWYQTFDPAIAYHKFMKLNVPLRFLDFRKAFTQFEPFLGPLSPPTIISAVQGPPSLVTVSYASPQLITTQSHVTDTIVVVLVNKNGDKFFSSSVDANRNGGSFSISPNFANQDFPAMLNVGFTPFRAATNMSPTAKKAVF